MQKQLKYSPATKKMPLTTSLCNLLAIGVLVSNQWLANAATTAAQTKKPRLLRPKLTWSTIVQPSATIQDESDDTPDAPRKGKGPSDVPSLRLAQSNEHITVMVLDFDKTLAIKHLGGGRGRDFTNWGERQVRSEKIQPHLESWMGPRDRHESIRRFIADFLAYSPRRSNRQVFVFTHNDPDFVTAVLFLCGLININGYEIEVRHADSESSKIAQLAVDAQYEHDAILHVDDDHNEFLFTGSAVSLRDRVQQRMLSYQVLGDQGLQDSHLAELRRALDLSQ